VYGKESWPNLDAIRKHVNRDCKTTREIFSKFICVMILKNSSLPHKIMGARDSVVVKALCYKPEGRGFETR
jgi:hypothetical protein